VVYRGDNGLPLAKIKKNVEFIPANPGEAKQSLIQNNLGLYDDQYDLKYLQDLYDDLDRKQNFLAGDFKLSYKYDNGKEVDEFGLKVPNSKKDSKNVSKANQMAMGDDGASSTRSHSHNLGFKNREPRMR